MKRIGLFLMLVLGGTLTSTMFAQKTTTTTISYQNTQARMPQVLVQPLVQPLVVEARVIKDAPIYTFADLCISRQMYTAIQAANRKKHTPLNSYISLYKNQEETDMESELIGAIRNSSERNPEEILIDRENVEAIEKIIENDLSPFERQVLELSMTGMNYQDIARLLGKDPKSTDNALNRVKTKIKKQLKNPE